MAEKKTRAANGAGSIYQTDKGWRGSIMLNGRRRYASGKNKSEVSEKLRAIKRAADDGYTQKGRSPKLKDWITKWLDATAPLPDLVESKRAKRHSLKTDENYRDVIDLYLPVWLGSIQLSKLEPDHLEDIYRDLTKQGFSQGTVYKLHTIIRAALSHAVKRGIVPKNAAKDVIKPPQPRATKIADAYSRADQAAIFEKLKGSRSRARWELAFGLGVRPGEALGLEWKHVDFKERSIKIEQQIQMIDNKLRLVPYAKSDRGTRKIPLPEYLADLLEEHQDAQLVERGAAGDKWQEWEPSGRPRAFVFTSRRFPGRPITPSGDRTQFNRILESAGLPAAYPYLARHTAASEMIASGLDITVVAEILGHDLKTLQSTYAHAIEERKIAAATVLDFSYLARSKTDAKIDAPKTEMTPAS